MDIRGALLLACWTDMVPVLYVCMGLSIARAIEIETAESKVEFLLLERLMVIADFFLGLSFRCS